MAESGVVNRGRQLLCMAANATWVALCLPDSVAFHRATRDVRAVQERLLLRLLQRNADTAFGRRHGFRAINSVREYRERVPLTSYEDYGEAVERIGDGEDGILTRDRVRLLEPTSGSSAATKLIPYTESLKQEFGRAIAPWIVDVFRRDPHLLCGPAYWSVTPVTQQGQCSPGGIPIGFEEDADYLGPLQAAMVNSVMAVPPEVKLIEDIDVFRYVTLLFLLRCRALALISVWNPTFLMLLLEKLDQWWPHLADDIEQGTITPPTPMRATVHRRLSARSKPAQSRAAEIRAAFGSTKNRPAVYAALWPGLRLISCWADAYAARYAAELAATFPHVQVQGKGLLATEGVVSFPLGGRTGAALAIRSHFLEFVPVDRQAPSLLAHELAAGETYSVVVTTGGGLYRYRLHDLVEVVGHLHTCPLVRFVDKEAHVSDRLGEKVDARHVDASLDHLLHQWKIAPHFTLVACEEVQGRLSYVLFIEANDRCDADLHALGGELEEALRENFHYRYCRELGQLDPVRVFRVTGGGRETYHAVCQARGQRAGDIKPLALDQRGGWLQALTGYLLPCDPSVEPVC